MYPYVSKSCTPRHCFKNYSKLIRIHLVTNAIFRTPSKVNITSSKFRGSNQSSTSSLSKNETNSKTISKSFILFWRCVSSKVEDTVQLIYFNFTMTEKQEFSMLAKHHKLQAPWQSIMPKHCLLAAHLRPNLCPAPFYRWKYNFVPFSVFIIFLG